MLTLIPFAVSKVTLQIMVKPRVGPLTPDLHSNLVSWVLTVLVLASQWEQEGPGGRRSGLEASALVTRCANWGHPLSSSSDLCPLMQDQELDSSDF